MADSSAASPTNLERLKLGLIPVLALVMYFVISSSDDESPAISAADDVESAPGAIDADDERPATQPMRLRARSLPQLPMAGILQHDPFAFPAAFSQRINPANPVPGQETVDTTKVETTVGNLESAAQSVATPQKLAALQQRRVTMFLRDRQGPAAVIGTKVVHVGDLLEDGVRVVEISSKGVVLEVTAP